VLFSILLENDFLTFLTFVTLAGDRDCDPDPHATPYRTQTKPAYPPTVVPDGYGLSYGIGADYIRWTITNVKANTRDGAELKHYLAEAATEVKHMMENAASLSVSAATSTSSEVKEPVPVKIRAKL
jgi:hypothetical protein